MALAARGNGRLVRKAGLASAMSRYHYVVRKARMAGEDAPHSLCYAYATEHLRRVSATGAGRRAGAAGISTWVEHVYGREALAGDSMPRGGLGGSR
ncbi:integrase domain-containing protein [Burkholderia stagnalis]|uniref:integrase domain-containing protein n=1 Tax=Burkholderia stagnalis TaxID=1503054 RepID=UPI0009C10C9C